MRIRRDRSWERAFLPAIEAAERDLRAGETPRLEALRDGLWASPGWRDILRGHGLSPSDLQSLDDLRHFPLLDRDTLLDRWRELAVVVVVDEQEELVVVRSSGSSGVPVSVVRRVSESLYGWAVLRFLAGPLPPRPRVVLLCALPDGVEYSAHLPLFFDGALHRISTRRPDAAERLRRVNPSVVTGDPESLRWLAENPVASPSLVVSSALHLDGALRAALPGRVVDVYSTTETGPIAWNDGGGFRILMPHVWVEDLGGELVVTRLRPGALPLLRYRTGDRGRVDSLFIRDFAGRRACSFRTPAGNDVDAWQLAPLLRDLSLRSFRVTQRAPEDFLVELDGPAEVATRLEKGLRALGFVSPTVTLGPPPVHGAKPEPFVTSSSAAGASR